MARNAWRGGHWLKLRQAVKALNKAMLEQAGRLRYHGGAKGFDQVLDLVEDACDGLLRHVKQKLQVARD